MFTACLALLLTNVTDEPFQIRAAYEASNIEAIVASQLLGCAYTVELRDEVRVLRRYDESGAKTVTEVLPDDFELVGTDKDGMPVLWPSVTYSVDPAGQLQRIWNDLNKPNSLSDGVLVQYQGDGKLNLRLAGDKSPRSGPFSAGYWNVRVVPPEGVLFFLLHAVLDEDSRACAALGAGRFSSTNGFESKIWISGIGSASEIVLDEVPADSKWSESDLPELFKPTSRVMLQALDENFLWCSVVRGDDLSGVLTHAPVTGTPREVFIYRISRTTRLSQLMFKTGFGDNVSVFSTIVRYAAGQFFIWDGSRVLVVGERP